LDLRQPYMAAHGNQGNVGANRAPFVNSLDDLEQLP